MTEPRTLKEVEQELAEMYEKTFRIYKDLMKNSEIVPDPVPFIKMRESISVIQMKAIKLQKDQT